MIQKYRVRMVILMVFLVCSIHFLSAEKLAVLKEVLQPEKLVIDGNQLYVREKETFYIYSMTDFKLTGKFGRRGEGPGDFRTPPDLCVFPDYLFCEDGIANRLSFFSRDGILKYEIRIPDNVYDINIVGKNFIGVESEIDPKTMITTKNINFYTKDFEQIMELSNWHGQESIFFPRGSNKKFDLEVIRDSFSYDVYDDRIYLADTRKGFYIAVYDSSGNKIYEIKKEYEKKEVSQEFKSKYTKKDDSKINRLKNINFVFRDYFPAFDRIEVKSGKIYVWTHEHKKDKQELLILDLRGKIIKKTFLTSQRYYSLVDYKYYCLIENENEDYELHVETLE